MSTKLVGFTVSTGTFIPEGSTDKIPYNNRVLHCVTNDDLTKDSVGFVTVDVKLKMETLASCFGVMPTDSEVNDFLSTLIMQEVEFKYSFRSGKPVCTGFHIIPDSYFSLDRLVDIQGGNKK